MPVQISNNINIIFSIQNVQISILEKKNIAISLAAQKSRFVVGVLGIAIFTHWKCI